MSHKKALVLGSSGFIGNHLVKDLKNKGFYVIGIDIKSTPIYGIMPDEFLLADLRETKTYELIADEDIERVYQLAANMGGAEYIFTGEHDLEILRDNLQIQLLFSKWLEKYQPKKVFFASSACVYPIEIQKEGNDYECAEHNALPANPDSVYGWEKLTAEMLYQTLAKTISTQIYIGRFHNIYGPKGIWKGGREKAPAAICRKVILAKEGEEIVIFGNGEQKRTFLYIDDCLEAIEALINTNFHEPINIGSSEVVSIRDLTAMVIDFSEKSLKIKATNEGPVGVSARSSNNELMEKKIGWKPSVSLNQGMKKLYEWIQNQVKHEI